MPVRRQSTRPLGRVSSEQSRIRDHRLDSRGPRARRGDCHKPSGVHPYVGRHPRCAERLRRADHRGAHFQRAQARAFPAAFLRLGRRFGHHRRLRNARLHAGAAADCEADQHSEAVTRLNEGRGSARVRIKESIDRLPGGLMLAPLLLGALCKTFAPSAPAYFKGFTQGIMTGVIPILAVWFFCMGSSIKLSATGTVLRKSGTLVLTKFFAAWAIVLVASQFIPPEGIQSGFFAGLSILAIVCAVDMTNGGLYASLMQTYGTKEEAGAFVLTSIESGPLMSMIILGASGAAHFEPQVFVGAVLPFLVGFALGNLDPKLREFFAPGGQLMIPFFAFALGNTIDLHSLFSPLAGLGIVLALSVILLTGVPLVIADKLVGRGTGTAGIAASSTAGAAAANPVAIAAVAPQFAPAVQQATVLVAICIVVTSIVVPILTGLWYRRFGQSMAEQTPADSLGPALQFHPVD